MAKATPLTDYGHRLTYLTVVIIFAALGIIAVLPPVRTVEDRLIDAEVLTDAEAMVAAFDEMVGR